MSTTVSTPGSKVHRLGDCMFGRHEFCKQVTEGGITCSCECGEKHGSKYVKPDIMTPIHVMTMKIVEAHKKGERYTVEADPDVTDGGPVIELNYQASEPLPQIEVENDVEDTLEQLEAKRD